MRIARLATFAVVLGLTASGLVAGSAAAASGITVTRYQGADRYGTSAAIVDANYSPGVPVVYIASGLNFPDALAGGAAAANAGGPLLLVEPGAIPPAVATELTRLTPASIVVLGGPPAVSDAVVTALQSYTTGTVTRVAGADRYATAADLAASFPSGSPVYIATGLSFPDALGATAAATLQHAAILLTDPNTLPASTAAALAALMPESITIIGGATAVSAGVAASLAAYSPMVTRISGSDRYATAAQLAANAFPDATGFFVASGSGFADALTGGPVAGKLGEPLLLATPTCLPASSTAVEAAALNPSTVTLLGGTASLGAGVAALTTCPTPPAPVAPTPAKITFGNGTRHVGASLPAGTYRTRTNATGCYWARLSGFSGDLSDTIANNDSDAHQVVTIAPTDAGFESSNCSTWTNDLSAITSSKTASFGDGMWIVNTDIAPGTWSAPGGDECYWARLSGFSGDLSDTIANDDGGNTPIVTIYSTDVGFISENCGQWTPS
ncbi:MAG TPA: cell wall-binding repeat-containing protein [Acidothermaceae bacterium]|jgi:putative cell wall-binding protein